MNKAPSFIWRTNFLRAKDTTLALKTRKVLYLSTS